MGRDLYETEPVARAVLDRCEAVVHEVRGASLLDVMFGGGGAEAGGGAVAELVDTAWEQPALYALGCALTALWSSVGVRPEVVVGHSVGEIAAAQAAGVFSLEDGVRFACARGALMSQMADGAMAAVFAPPGPSLCTVTVVVEFPRGGMGRAGSLALQGIGGGGSAGLLRRTLRRGGAPANRTARLSVPAQTPLVRTGAVSSSLRCHREAHHWFARAL